MSLSLIVESLRCRCAAPIEWGPGRGWVHVPHPAEVTYYPCFGIRIDWGSARWTVDRSLPLELARARQGREVAA